jgi:hypothetical protein
MLAAQCCPALPTLIPGFHDRSLAPYWQLHGQVPVSVDGNAVLRAGCWASDRAYSPRRLANYFCGLRNRCALVGLPLEVGVSRYSPGEPRLEVLIAVDGH